MYREKTVGVVVPAYNEEGFVGEVIDTIPAFVDRVYPVDDCSTDRTWAEIRAHADRLNDSERPLNDSERPVTDGHGRELRRADSGGGATDGGATDGSVVGDADDRPARRVVALRHEENRGVGAAIKTGYRRAREDGMDAVAVMAGDGQMDPDYLPRVLDPVVSGRADYAKGNRLLLKSYREEMSDWRLFGNALLTMLTKIASGYWKMMDPQNGYTAISHDALDALDLDSIFDDYGFANAMLVHLNVAEMRVADVPMPARYGDEDSDIRYSTFVPQLSALLARGFGWRLTTKYLVREFHPLAFLYGLGVLGTLAGLYGSVRDRVRGERGCGPATALVGLLSGVLAMAFDRYENDDRYVRTDPEAGEASVGTDPEEGEQ
ncbi:glycosyltransferase family 2 protein [Halorussus salilacus]|uniref:glycosyltransferase family 2 protein n=1 Tax=Halorussus salilacus TaxID=2953750 RepID=UPI0020A0883F|nr:glycosyltransferase family 2 protein [Halorussus salilacus]USZ68098.1 glycosyltransferase family 2 protein [Halorussus salilacus]